MLRKSWKIILTGVSSVSQTLTRSWQGHADKDTSSSSSSINSFDDLVAVNGVKGLKGISLGSSTTAAAWRDFVWGSLMRVSGFGWSSGAAVNWFSAAMISDSAITHSGINDLPTAAFFVSRPVSATLELVSIPEENSPVSSAWNELRFYWKWPVSVNE